MAGKACMLTSRRLAFALDRLSKNTLIDLVVDLARRQIGAEMEDGPLAEQIQEWLDPVTRERDDRPVNLIACMAKLDKNDEDYRNRTGKFRQVGKT